MANNEPLTCLQMLHLSAGLLGRHAARRATAAFSTASARMSSHGHGNNCNTADVSLACAQHCQGRLKIKKTSYKATALICHVVIVVMDMSYKGQICVELTC